MSKEGGPSGGASGNEVPTSQVKNYQAHAIFDKYKYGNFDAAKCTQREMELFANTERQKHVKIKKFPNETFGFMITETGKTSLLPCVFISHIFPGSAAARCGQLFVGDQILFLNGMYVYVRVVLLLFFCFCFCFCFRSDYFGVVIYVYVLASAPKT